MTIILNDEMKKTPISTIVCLDIIDFPKKKLAEQTAIKKQFNSLVELAVVDIPQEDRSVVHTEHGAVVTCTGTMESALEDALFIALTVRDEVVKSNASSDAVLYLHIGINLGSAAIDENNHVVGEGLIETQQIKSFANPNQILVSRAYHDLASKLTKEVAQMFEKYDMHAFEDDIYAVRLLKGSVVGVDDDDMDHIVPADEPEAGRTDGWRAYVLPLLLAVVMLFVLIKWMQHDNEASIVESVESSTQESLLPPPVSAADVDEAEAELEVKEVVLEGDSAEEATEAAAEVEKKPVAKAKPKAKKRSSAKKKVNKPNTKLIEEIRNAEQVQIEYAPAEVEEVEAPVQPPVSTCSQAQRAMHQCN